jgi:Family of unknown function (DUF6492)
MLRVWAGPEVRDAGAQDSSVAELAVITPSYAPDIDLCQDLNRSVLACTEPSVTHHIIIPRRDLGLFSRLRGPRTQVWPLDELMPRHLWAVPWVNVWLNLHRPVPPVRGWVMQQVVKLQAAAQIGADVLLLVDSDVRVVRPVTAETFRHDGRLRFYRKNGGVDEHLPRHLVWHDVARRLLGLPGTRPPLPDYISAFNVWQRSTVLALQERIEQVTGRSWLDAIGAQLHFSEDILYGLFVDQVLGERAEVEPSESMLCHSYWDTRPLNADGAERFIRAMPAGDVAVMISAKSRTPLDVRRAALAGL